jgi:hypothetical protein
MSRRITLHTYEALTDFTSKSLDKTFLKGQIIRAPHTIGASWVQSKLAKRITNPKSIQP